MAPFIPRNPGAPGGPPHPGGPGGPGGPGMGGGGGAGIGMHIICGGGGGGGGGAGAPPPQHIGEHEGAHIAPQSIPHGLALRFSTTSGKYLNWLLINIGVTI